MRYVKCKGINLSTINFYRGCLHNCIYCDARSKCYGIKDFEDIEVKENALELIEEELKKKKKKCMVNTGSMCDPYIPIEKDLCLTRRMLELIRDYGFGLSILTKSTMIFRDINLIEEINKNYRAAVFMTITTYDDELCKQIERNVEPSSLRFECLEEFHKRNIPIGIWLTPILPFINDTEENLINILNKCLEIGVEYIVSFGFGTTKRAGSEEYFYKCLDKYFPGVKMKYIKAYGDSYECSTPNAERLWSIFTEFCNKHGILYNLFEINQKLGISPK